MFFMKIPFLLHWQWKFNEKTMSFLCDIFHFWFMGKIDQFKLFGKVQFLTRRYFYQLQATRWRQRWASWEVAQSRCRGWHITRKPLCPTGCSLARPRACGVTMLNVQVHAFFGILIALVRYQRRCPHLLRWLFPTLPWCTARWDEPSAPSSMSDG